MRKGKFESAPRPRRKGSKAAALILALVLVVGCVVGGTLAWLTAKSDVVTNTFTTSDITVKLEETTGTEYKMVPGCDIPKDPKAWVASDSEECYLFVKLDKTNNFDSYLTYTVDTSENQWTKLTGEGITDEIYYRIVKADDITAETKFDVLKDNKVSVKGDVTKEMMNSLTAETLPKLTVTAYASQLHKNATEDFDALTAWNNITTK